MGVYFGVVLVIFFYSPQFLITFKLIRDHACAREADGERNVSFSFLDFSFISDLPF